MAITNSQIEIKLCPTCGNEFPPDTRSCPHDGVELINQMSDPLVGTLLPRHYRITRKLGRGAMSVVYHGVYEPLGQEVAIKLLKSHLVSDQSTFRRFQQEAQTAGALDHPNIVSILDFGVTDQGVPYLIMEMLSGENLQQKLKREGPLSVAAALRIFCQIADALECTHQRGIVHRDVKPSNIFITQDDEGEDKVKIVDFGIAKLQTADGDLAAASLTQTGEVFGSPLYVSPEQATGGTIDARADIYSLGCVMYEAIAGKSAFGGGTIFEILRQQVKASAPPVDTLRPGERLPPRLVSAIQKAMEKDPNARYQSMAELLIDLDRAATELAVLRTAPEELKPASKVPESKRGEAKVLAAMGLYPKEPAPVSVDDLAKITATNLARATATKLPKVQAMSEAEAKPLPPFLQGIVAIIRGTPFVPIICSSLVGCLVGVLILAWTHMRHETDRKKPYVPTHQTTAFAEEVPDQSQVKLFNEDAEQLRQLALAAYDRKDYADAEYKLHDALALVQNSRDRLGEGRLLADLCMVDIALRKFSEAYRAGASSLKLLDRPGVPKKDISFALRGLGTVSYYRTDYSNAEKLLKRSCALDKSIYGVNDERYAVGITRLARVLESEKKFDEAEAYYKEAVAVSKKCHHKGDLHLSERLFNLAEFQRRRNRPKEAQALDLQAQQYERQ